MSETQRPSPEIGTRIVETLQRHASRDRVELVVDLGVEWAEIEPALDKLVSDGYVISSESEGEQVFKLSRYSASRSFGEVLSD
jgi:predicted ArsR family transcriptional regulator